ncbi:MAG TPA: hypothetical protein VIZ30_10995 [Pseudomonadales bacterium]
MRRGIALVCCVAIALIARVAFGDAPGTVVGTVALTTMKPMPVAPGYKAATKQPIGQADAPRAVVYLERDDGVYPPPDASPPRAIGQQGYQFRPGVSAVRTGTQVGFPNHDDEFHSVFSYSRVKRFDLGRFRKDEQSPLITFDQPGVVKIYCEIHKHMRSLLLVLDTPWFTQTDDEGHFTLKDIPPGDYRLRVFLPSEDMLEGRVTVVAGETVQAETAH